MCWGMCHDGEQLGVSPSQEKEMGKAGTCCTWCCKATCAHCQRHPREAQCCHSHVAAEDTGWEQGAAGACSQPLLHLGGTGIASCPLRHRARLHEAVGQAPAGKYLAHDPSPGGCWGELCPVLLQGSACFPAQLRPRQLTTPAALGKHHREQVPEAFQVLPPPLLQALPLLLVPDLPPGSLQPLAKQTRALDARFVRIFPSQPSSTVSQLRFLLVHLVPIIFITGKVLPSWLLGTGTGAGVAAAWLSAAPCWSSGHKLCRDGTASPLQWGSSLQMPVHPL